MDLNFDDERAQLTAKRAELLAGVEVIDAALAALAKGMANNGASSAPAGGIVRAGRRPMSPKARKAASLRMKQYWAAKRKQARSR